MSVTTVIPDDSDGTSASRDLTVFGSPTLESSTAAKFGQGFGLDGGLDYLTQGSTAFQDTGAVTVFIRFRADSVSREHQLFAQSLSGEFEASNTHYSLVILPNNTLQYQHEYDDGQDFTWWSIYTVHAGEFSVWLRRDTGFANVAVDGVTVMNITIDASFDPTGGTSTRFYLGKHPERANQNQLLGGILEARQWGSAVANATLSTIASTTGTSTAEGTENAYWVMDAVSNTSGGTDANEGIIQFGEGIGFESPAGKFFYGLMIAAAFAYATHRSVSGSSMLGNQRQVKVYIVAGVAVAAFFYVAFAGIWPRNISIVIGVIMLAALVSLMVVKLMTGSSGGANEGGDEE